MKIPEVRIALQILANEITMLGLPEQAQSLRKLIGELHRRPYVRKNPSKRPHVSYDIIRAYAAAHPNDDYTAIATALNVRNNGRISEALAGYRD